MHCVTLLCPPDNPALEFPAVDALRNAWGGGQIDWLSPDEAAEFSIPRLPGNLWKVWDEFQTMGVDLVVQRSENRRKSVLLADMDSTLIHQECVDELAAVAGFGPQVAEITASAMNGEIDFSEALRARVSLLCGLDVSVIGDVLRDRISLMPGGPVLCATMKAGGAYLALVSGGFTGFTQDIARRLGFDEHRANRLLESGGRLTGEVADPILGLDAKVAALGQITGQLGLSASDVIAVGDGANDLGMLGLAGTGVALHAKPAVAAKCDVRINHGDLTALLYLQGIRRDEFCGSQS